MEDKNKSDNRSKTTVRTFAIASFLHDLGSDMVFSVWPLYVTSVLGANATVLGLIDGLGDAIVSISQAASGYLSDRLKKRKIFVWLGYLFGSISRLGYAFAPTWQFLIPFRVIDRSGKMRDAPRDVIISEVTTTATRGTSFGVLRAMDNLGAVFGILAAIFLVERIGFRNLFLLAAIPSLLAVAIIILFIKKEGREEIKLFKGIQFKDVSFNMKLYTLLSAIFALGSFSYSFLLLYAHNRGVTIAAVPIFYLLFTLIAAIFSLPFGKLSDKIGRKAVLYLAFLFWIGVSIVAVFVKSGFGLIGLFVLYGLHKAALEPVQKSFVTELSPKEFIGSSIGGFQMIIGLCSLPASFVAGLLWDKVGHVAPFYYSAILTIIATTILIMVKDNSQTAL